MRTFGPRGLASVGRDVLMNRCSFPTLRIALSTMLGEDTLLIPQVDTPGTPSKRESIVYNAMGPTYWIRAQRSCAQITELLRVLCFRLQSCTEYCASEYCAYRFVWELIHPVTHDKPLIQILKVFALMSVVIPVTSQYFISMPSQITHSLFGTAVMETLQLTVNDALWFNLGCQGPDIFLHNQRTKPSSLTWGRQLHRNGYGTYTGFLAASLKEMGKELDSPEGSYLLGFITHAVLDRISHPYIVYHAGWGKDHRFFHPLLERLIDSAMAEHLGKEKPGSVSFFTTIDLGETPPASFIQLHTGPIDLFIRKTYAEKEIHQRLRNAYFDTMHFLRKTDLWDDKLIRNVINHEDPVRRAYLISVFHPPRIPRYLDILNRERRVWHHPWDEELSSCETFPELFSKGVQKSSELLQLVLAEWNQWNERSPSVIASVIGNESLDTGLPYDPHLPPMRKAPLPLGRFFSDFF